MTALGARVDDGATGCREQVWGRETGFAVAPVQGDLEGIWWETSSGKSHQVRRGLGFTALKIPGS